ncbi:hypothetical protein K474DRAFT_1706832 [Panus rudis PR-1116 ss-1]|nr:hypothetical protein K474DRAFT_1706832 [Panus rudis PR-1116 ss-1]
MPVFRAPLFLPTLLLESPRTAWRLQLALLTTSFHELYMSTPTPASFYTSNSPQDPIAILILVETSNGLAQVWSELSTQCLAPLLQTLRAANPTVPIQLYWQTTSSPSPASIRLVTSAPGEGLGAIPSPPPNGSPAASITGASLRTSIDTLRAAFRPQRATRHLILIASNTPLQDYSGTQALHAIASSIVQYGIRIHMVLSHGPRVQPLRELHQRTLHLQRAPAVSPWFEVDATRYQILLSGNPSTYTPPSGTPNRPSVDTAQPVLHSTAPTAIEPSRSTSTASSNSPPHLAGRLSPDALSTSPRARNLGKQKASSPSHASSSATTDGESPKLGLVSYLQRMHGLSKKRNYSSKKRGSVSNVESANPETSTRSTNRPILPRLDLPSSSSVSVPTPQTSAPAQTDYVAGGSPGTSPSSDNSARRSRPRWPWLLPAPLPAISSAPGSPGSSSREAALRSLAMMTPRHPSYAPHIASASGSETAGHAVSPMGGEVQGPHELSNPSLSTESPVASVAGPTPFLSQSGGLQTGARHPSQDQTSNPEFLTGPSYFHAIGQESTRSPFAASSPAQTSSLHAIDDPGDQPFVITPEYEALANAQFEEALRTGAMQTTMSPSAMAAHATVGGSSSVPHGAGYQTDYFAGQTTISPSAHSATSASHGVVDLQQTYYDYTRAAPYGAQVEESPEGTNEPNYSSAGRSFDQHGPGSQPSDRWYGT